MQYGMKSRPKREPLLSGNWYGYVGRKTIWLLDTLRGGNK